MEFPDINAVCIEKAPGMRKAHLELYEYLKKIAEDGKQFHKQDLFMIYTKHVIRHKSHYGDQTLSKEQIQKHAGQWLNSAIGVLVCRGYLGLTFKK